MPAFLLLAALTGADPVFAQTKGKTQPAKTQQTKTPPTPESEYAARYKGAEAALAGGDRPYFILDSKKLRLRLKIRGATVKDYYFKLADGDSEDVKDFCELAGSGDSVAKAMVRLHVFESERQLNDTVLGIVAGATTAPAELIQRYRPERLTVTFQDRLVLDVRALDINGTESSWSANLAERLRLFADDLLGGETLTIYIPRDDAMSFYGACQNAPPLLVAP
ncbi:MAG: hypothetical protein AB1772_01270 [Candidatus Zixiibacteriota bacterium]